ncbi:hypothetical protein B0H34DRAFT_514537 [Crassisporium funariophilum]|nr:hypothetical protein B0H34DRAFT_514537 [Crassisporium funariophilum]
MQSTVLKRSSNLALSSAQRLVSTSSSVCRRELASKSFRDSRLSRNPANYCVQFHRQSHTLCLSPAFPHKQKSRCYSSRSQVTDIVFPDPNRPDLFYHFVNPPTPLSRRTLPAFALSFLEHTPPSVDSPTVLGWLPAQTYMTDTPGTSGPEDAHQQREASAGLHDFVENPKFVTLLHETVRSVLRDGLDEVWENGAKQLQEGWMHIHDQRNIPALGRIGDPDDIIGTVCVENSKIVPDTYQPMPSYRICTSDGVLQLTDGLSHHLHANLIRVTKEEEARSK